MHMNARCLVQTWQRSTQKWCGIGLATISEDFPLLSPSLPLPPVNLRAGPTRSGLHGHPSVSTHLANQRKPPEYSERHPGLGFQTHLVSNYISATYQLGP